MASDSSRDDSDHTPIAKKRPHGRRRWVLVAALLILIAAGAFVGKRIFDRRVLEVDVREAGGIIWSEELSSIREEIEWYLDGSANRFHGIPTSIEFFESSVDDNWIAKHASALGQLTELNLNLGRTQISDESLVTIGKLRNLGCLDLFESAVSDEGLKRLHPLSGLGHLNIAHTRVTDQGLRVLTHFPELFSLDLDGSQVTPAGIEIISRLKDLSILKIYDATDEVVENLSGIPRISCLTLHGRELTDASVQPLSELSNLTILHLWDCSISDEGISKLKQNPYLGVRISRVGQAPPDD